MLITGQSDPPSSRLPSHSLDGVSGGGDTSDNDTDSITTTSTVRDSSVSALSVSTNGRLAVQPGGSGRASAAKNSVFEQSGDSDSDSDTVKLAARMASLLSLVTDPVSVLSVLWWSGVVVSALASINEVNQRRTRLVLRWVTMSGFNSQCRTFIFGM